VAPEKTTNKTTVILVIALFSALALAALQGALLLYTIWYQSTHY